MCSIYLLHCTVIAAQPRLNVVPLINFLYVQFWTIYNCYPGGRKALFGGRSEVDEDDSDHEKFAISLRDQLIRLMEDKVAEMSSDDMFLPKLKLQETVLQFRQMYGTHPMNLVRIIKNCLSTEMKLVQDADSVCSF